MERGRFSGRARIEGSDVHDGVIRLNVHVFDAGGLHPFRTITYLPIHHTHTATRQFAEARLAAIMAATGRMVVHDTEQLHGRDMDVIHDGADVLEYLPRPKPVPAARSTLRRMWDRYSDAAHEARDLWYDSRYAVMLYAVAGLAWGVGFGVLLERLTH